MGFVQLVDEMSRDYVSDHNWTPDAVHMLQCAAEDQLMSLCSKARTLLEALPGVSADGRVLTAELLQAVVRTL